MITASPCKLRTGEWGVRITGDRSRVGETVRVETRAGKTWTATIASIVWEGDDAMIASTARGGRAVFNDTYNEGGDGYTPHQPSGSGRCRSRTGTWEPCVCGYCV